jgi:hypothetical protein
VRGDVQVTGVLPVPSSSWEIEDGFARPLGTPKVKRRGPETVREKIARELGSMDAAKAEISRRIAARAPRHRSRR